MLFQAHRGVSSEYPENTLPAFAAAARQGYQVIELDPLFTADGQCVVFHDMTLTRTCRNDDGSRIAGEIKAADLTYEELAAYDAGIFMGEQFRGTRVPLLSQVLELAVKENLMVKIDNRFADFPAWQQEKLFDIVAASGATAAFTCKNPEITQKVVERFPDAPVHYDGYVDEETVKTVSGLLKNNPYTVWLALPSELTSWVTVPTAAPELCAMVKRYAQLGLWILDDQQQLEQAKSLGADIIETTGAVKPQ